MEFDEVIEAKAFNQFTRELYGALIKWEGGITWHYYCSPVDSISKMQEEIQAIKSNPGIADYKVFRITFSEDVVVRSFTATPTDTR